MSIRGIMLKYLGWCPGVRDAYHLSVSCEVEPTFISRMFQLVVYLDDNVFCETIVHSEYYVTDVDFRWRAF